MRTLHRLVDAISARSPFVYLTPATYSIGNCSEELFFGLLRARREGKKLVILRPYELPRMFRFTVQNRELFDVTSPLLADIPSFLKIPIQAALTAVYGSLRALDLLLGKLFGPKAHFDVRFISPGFGGTTLWQPEEEPAEFRWDVVEKYRWTEEIQKPLTVGLRPEKRALAHALRLEMGIPENAWFVGLHVREPGFVHKNEAPSCRNSTIANYIPAIREITARGGWVVRLGDRSMTPLSAMERVIDYPFTRFKSDLMDLYFIGECRFYVGTLSGVLDTALLFQRPMVLTNMTNTTFVYPRRPEDRGITKHVFSKSKGRFLSLRELLSAPWEAQQFRTLGDDYEMFENSPGELRTAMVEFLDGLERGPSAPTPLQVEANRVRLENGRRLVGGAMFKDPHEDIYNRYRIAARLESSLGSLSRAFVEANWERSVHDGVPAGKEA